MVVVASGWPGYGRLERTARWHAACSSGGMATIKSYRELVCWQLAVELRRAMIAICDRPRVRAHFKFCEQAGDAARSAPANIAEGFRRSNRLFSRYLDIALGSLQETENHVDEALERRFISLEEHVALRTIAKRAIRAAEELRAYLRRGSARRLEPDTPSPDPPQPDETPTNPSKPDAT